jgi:hypothetical protein
VEEVLQLNTYARVLCARIDIHLHINAITFILSCHPDLWLQHYRSVLTIQSPTYPEIVAPDALSLKQVYAKLLDLYLLHVPSILPSRSMAIYAHVGGSANRSKKVQNE